MILALAGAVLASVVMMMDRWLEGCWRTGALWFLGFTFSLSALHYVLTHHVLT